MNTFTVLYFVAMTAVVVAVLLLLRHAQKAVLEALARVLYLDHDPARYLAMLENKRLSLVLRRSTRTLLRLVGHIQAGNAAGVEADATALEGMKLRPEERLEYCQKCMDFYLSRGEYGPARECLARLEALLEGEPDGKLKATLADARLLIAIYADRDTSLIPKLEAQAAAQTGNQKGVTEYRLAKLCHFAGDESAADDWLSRAAELLKGTPWAPIVSAARADHTVLDER